MADDKFDVGYYAEDKARISLKSSASKKLTKAGYLTSGAKIDN